MKIGFIHLVPSSAHPDKGIRVDPRHKGSCLCADHRGLCCAEMGWSLLVAGLEGQVGLDALA